MYDLFTQISNVLAQPFYNIARQVEGLPILFAFLLGIVGALVPCQFTANLGAVTIYGNKSLQKQVAWAEVIFFTIGKIVVFSMLGFIVWLLGSEIKFSLIDYFPWFRKAIGPLFVIVGLFMLGLFKFYKTISLGKIPERWTKKGKTGAFLMGAGFTLGFCPTMFSLFFITLMPVSLSVSYGAVLPTVFAMGTSFPFILVIFLLWYFDLSGKLVRKQGRKLGLIVQKGAGVLMIIIGVLDTITYW